MIRSSIQQGIILLALSAIFAFGYNTIRDDRLPLIAQKPSSEGVSKIDSLLSDTVIIYEPIWVDLELAKEMYNRGITFIDARDEDEYRRGHIKNAILELPPVELLNMVSPDQPVVTYCSGIGCELSVELAETLIDWGYTRVFIFQGGWPEWKNAGYPIESSQ